MVSYLDDFGLVPELKAFVFVGRNLAEDDEGEVYFQDAVSYSQGARLGDEPVPEGAYILRCRPDEVPVMEFEEALEALAQCRLMRREAPSLVEGK
jgi:hypothetical protein